MTKRHGEGLWIAAVVCLYAASFVLPVTAAHSGWFGNSDLGWVYFVLGLVYILTGYVAMIVFWFPNLLLIIGVILLLIRRHRAAMILGIIALLGAAQWLPGAPHMGPGYYCWLASMLLLTIAGGRLATHSGCNATQQDAAEQAQPVIPGPAAFVLFNPSHYKPPLPLEVRPATPQDHRPSSIRPPCSPSS